MNDFYKAMLFLSEKIDEENIYDRFKEDVVTQCKDFGVWHQFDWFRVKFFKKGTMHFEFTDIDVWYRFNQIAAKHKGWSIGSVSQCKARKVWRDIK